MLRGAFENAGEHTPESLQTAYADRLAATIESVGLSTVAEQTDIDADRLRALADGEVAGMTLEEATEVLATDDELPDAETLHAEAQDILLMGMSMAVLDVEALASGVNDAMEPREIQQKVEGRFPMTLAEYALLHSYIERRKR